jgi:chromosome segregation ATPase
MANPIVKQINAELSELQKELAKFKDTVDYLNGAKAAVKDAVIKVNHSEAHFNKKVEELKLTYNSIIKLTDSVSSVIIKLDTINFPERLDSIEKAVKDTILYLNETKKATLEELQKASEIITKADFDGRFKNLQTIINESVKSNENLANSIENQKLPEKIERLEKNVNKKLESFEKGINETLDEIISDLEENTDKIAKETAKSIHDLNIPTRLDKLDANIAGIMAAIQSIQSRLDNVERNLSDKISDISDKQKEEFSSIKSIMELTSKKHQTFTYITWGLITIGVITIIFLTKNNFL